LEGESKTNRSLNSMSCEMFTVIVDTYGGCAIQHPQVVIQVGKPSVASEGSAGPDVCCRVRLTGPLKPLRGRKSADNCTRDCPAEFVTPSGWIRYNGGGGLTTKVNVSVCVIAPEFPVMVMVYLPGWVKSVVVTVSVNGVCPLLLCAVPQLATWLFPGATPTCVSDRFSAG